MDNKLRKQLAPIFEQIGAIVQTSQQMEMGIAYSITLIRRIDSTAFTDDEFEESMEVLSKKTLGRLIKEIKKIIKLNNSDIISLELALDERNYIIHKFFNDNIEQFVTPEGRELCFERIRLARKNIHPGFMVLDNIVKNMMKISGLDPKQIFEEAESSIKI